MPPPVPLRMMLLSCISQRAGVNERGSTVGAGGGFCVAGRAVLLIGGRSKGLREQHQGRQENHSLRYSRVPQKKDQKLLLGRSFTTVPGTSNAARVCGSLPTKNRFV